jgi:hypothetical protein
MQIICHLITNKKSPKFRTFFSNDAFFITPTVKGYFLYHFLHVTRERERELTTHGPKEPCLKRLSRMKTTKIVDAVHENNVIQTVGCE